MRGIAAPITTFQTGCHWSAGRISDTAASGTKTSSSTTVCEPVARRPSVSHVRSMPDALGAERYRAVQHLRAVGGVVPADARHEDVPRLAPARRRLAGGHPVPAFDPPRAAAGGNPVRGSGADQDGTVVDDLTEDPGGVHPVVVPPDLRGDEVAVHRERDGRRGVVRPSSRRSPPTSACDAPPPPDSSGTRALVAPVLRRLSNASSEISPLRSRSAAEGPGVFPISRAIRTQSVPVSVAVGLAVFVMLKRLASAAVRKQSKDRTDPVQNLDRRAPPHEVPK